MDSPNAAALDLQQYVLEGLERRLMMSAGALDPKFGTAGKVITQVGVGGQARAVAVQADSKIVVGGDDTFATGDTTPTTNYAVVARYNADGTLDRAFGVHGKVTLRSGAPTVFLEDVAVQKDQKILAVLEDGNGVEVVRLTTAGAVDTTFGKKGYAVVNAGNSGGGEVLAVQTDGKILVGSSVTSTRGDEDFLIARLTPAGVLDPTWGSKGLVQANFGNNNDELGGLVVQQDGKVLAAGRSGVNTGNGPVDSAVLVRYTSLGKLDKAFASGGVVKVNALAGFTTVLVQPDSKILVRGTDPSNHQALARYTPAGAPDATFGANGLVLTNLGDSGGGDGMALQKSGAIVTIDLNIPSTTVENFLVARYNAKGRIDTTFGTGGTTSTGFVVQRDGSELSFQEDLAVQSDGNIVVVGSTFDDRANQDDFALARYLGSATAAAVPAPSVEPSIEPAVAFNAATAATGPSRARPDDDLAAVLDA